MAPVAEDGTAPPALSSAGWFFLLPELECAADSVVPDVCLLVLVAERALPVTMYGAAQHDRTLATILDGLAAVGRASPWPTCEVPRLLPHDGRSDSLVRYKQCSAVPRSPSPSGRP